MQPDVLVLYYYDMSVVLSLPFTHTNITRSYAVVDDFAPPLGFPFMFICYSEL